VLQNMTQIYISKVIYKQKLFYIPSMPLNFTIKMHTGKLLIQTY